VTNHLSGMLKQKLAGSGASADSGPKGDGPETKDKQG
jgi:hypothetical protein